MLQALTFLLLARWSSVEQFALIASFLAASIFLHTVFDLGLSTYIIKTRSEDPKNPEIAESLFYNSIALTITGCAIFITLISTNFFDIYSSLWLSIWFALEKVSDTWLCVHQGDGSNKLISLSVLRRRSVSLSIFFALYHFGLNPILSFSIGLGAGSLYSFASLINLTRQNISLNNHFHPFRLIKKTYPYWINSIAAQIRNLDVMLLTVLAGATQGAQLAIANRLISPLSMVASSMAMVLLPAVAKKEITSKHYHRIGLLTTAGASAPILALILIADSLVPLALGPQYISSIPVIQIVATGLIALSADAIYSSILQGRGMAKTVATISGSASIFYIGALVLVAPEFGALGTAYLFAFVYGTRLTASIFFIEKMKCED